MFGYYVDGIRVREVTIPPPYMSEGDMWSVKVHCGPATRCIFQCCLPVGSQHLMFSNMTPVI